MSGIAKVTGKVIEKDMRQTYGIGLEFSDGSRTAWHISHGERDKWDRRLQLAIETKTPLFFAAHAVANTDEDGREAAQEQFLQAIKDESP